MVPHIQALYPKVTANQIHAAWSDMSEVLWKQNHDQLLSAQTLLAELGNDVDIFNIKVADGVQQVCWGMKKILGHLKGKVVEIGIDATCMFY